jgi:methyltransferase-like protein
MIDIENEVIDTVMKAVQTAHTTVKVYSENPERTNTLPCVTIEQVDNSVYPDTMTSGNVENHAMISFDINIYTSSATGKKQEAKSIAKTIDTSMAGLGLVRTFSGVLPNIVDLNVYRLNMKYSAVVSQDKHTFAI